MTVSNATNKVIGAGNGATTVWPFSFKVFDPGDLTVIFTTAAGASTTLVSSAYVVALNADQEVSPGGTVTYAPAIAAGTLLTILREVDYTQDADIVNQGGFYPSVIERALDRMAMMSQQLLELTARCLKLSPSQSAIGELQATDANRANTFLGFGPTGLATLFSGLASTAVSLAMQPVIAAANLAAARTAMGVGDGQITNTLLADMTGPAIKGRTAGVGAPQDIAATSLLAVIAANSKIIGGLTYGNDSTDAANDLNIAAGGCMDSTGARWIAIAATTKQSDVAWAVDNGATPSGMLDTGAVANSDYFLYAILNPTTGATAVLCSLSATVPTLPAGYTLFRQFGWFRRTAGAIVAFSTVEIDGGGLEFIWTTPLLGINTTLSTARQLNAVNVPSTIMPTAILDIVMQDTTAAFYAIICDPREADGAPSGSAAPLANLTTNAASHAVASRMRVRTDASARIAARSSTTTVNVYRAKTVGFTMSRR